MGMISNYLRVSQSELESYLEDSTKLEERVYSDDNHKDTCLIDIEKSWEGLFYILTGKSLAEEDEAKAPFAWILNAPQVIDEEQDMGYGPANYITAEQTKELSTAMNKMSIEQLKDRFDGDLMNEEGVYPVIWDEEDALEYLLEYFKLLKDFFKKAAAENQAVIQFID